MKRLLRNHGFTLTEMLAALAILIILFGVSAPLVSNWRITLKMAELDNHARELYLSAQYQLTALTADGGLEQFVDDVMGEGNPVTTAPDDYDGDNWSEEKVYYILSDDAVTTKLLASVSYVNNLPGSYIIELDLNQGAVYSVFYWEVDDAETTLETKVYALNSRSRTDRIQDRIGYYGGDLTEGLPELLTLDLQGEIINSEELYIKLSFENTRVLRTYKNKLTVTIDVTGETSGATYSWSESGDKDPLTGRDLTVGKTNRLETYILLDSMEDGLGFVDITEGRLIPGENLSVQVSAVFEAVGSYPACTAEWTADGASSLFASRSGANIEVASVRHLKNLDESFFNDGIAAGNVPDNPNITQTAEIDFLNTNFAWDRNSYEGIGQANPLNNIVPITNGTLFDSGSFEGGSAASKIKNFVVIGEANQPAGLFSCMEGMELRDIFVENIRVVGGSGASGGLAGIISGCTVESCGICLSNANDAGAHYSGLDSSDVAYDNEMSRRLSYYSIQGSGAVGGLVGEVLNTDFTACFAATCVTGGTSIGGFVGTTTGTSTATDCYSSGDVVGGTLTGGFVGNGTGLTATNCYSSGDVWAATRAGGFVGHTGTYVDCVSYGEVLGLNGIGLPTSSGGFTGASDITCSNCIFLTQENYNDAIALIDNLSAGNVIAGIGTQTYFGLTAHALGEIPLSESHSHPYDGNLVASAFPFAPVQSDHYGDWPPKYTIDTSLVYYEHYQDGSYGYYCVTGVSSATTSSDGEDRGDNMIWVLDTLDDTKVVEEDGYALLSVYKLTKITYKRTQVASVDSPTTSASMELTVVDAATGPGSGRAVELRKQGALEFKGYRNDNGLLTAETDYSGLPHSATHKSSGMYLFQLPYELQDPDRASLVTFYDGLIITEGYVDGNQVIDDDQVFYYCPHFAKSAINPGTGANSFDITSRPSYARVRTARHLNALGRYGVYWNAVAGTNDDIDFLQERDVNFSRYTTSYCGKQFYMNVLKNENGQDVDVNDNVLTITNDVRNEPIGNYGGSKNKQFSNTYDGGGHRIIDYCMQADSDIRFVGLFGEVIDAEIKNIVMTVSEEGAGKIISAYNATASNGGAGGFGALIGLNYREYDQGSGRVRQNTIKNCAAAGYVLSYSFTGNYGVAAGGLIGYSHDDVFNCSAANNLVVTANSDQPMAVGGLIGSACYGTIQDCYAGGSIELKTTGNKSAKVGVGGVIGGVYEIYCNVGANNAGELGQYQNNGTYGTTPMTTYNQLYSYTNILVADTFQNVTETGSAANIIIVTPYGITNTPQVSANRILVSDCYYYDEDETINDNDLVLTYGELRDLQLGGAMTRADEANSYPIDPSIRGAYPFPAVVSGVTTASYVHYGDWPQGRVVYLSEKYPTYFEKYNDGTVGYFYVDEVGTSIRNLAGAGDTRTITETGYGILSATEQIDRTPVTVVVLDGDVQYYLYEETLLPSTTAASTEKAFTYELYALVAGVRDQDYSETLIETRYINENLAAAISANPLGTTQNPLEVRSLDQFQQVDDVTGPTVIMVQTYNISLANLSTSTNVQAGHTYDGGATAGFALLNATITPFGVNNGTITNTAVRKSRIAGSAGFVTTNRGSVTKSLSHGSIDNSNGAAAGFVETNTGSITQCYANCTVRSATDYEAAGFALDGGIISQSYSCGQVNAPNNTAYGFLKNGNATDCYSISAVSGAAYFGFAADNATLDGCYWGYDVGLNAGVQETDPNRVTLTALETLTVLGTLDVPAVPDTAALGNSYPYPSKVGLIHYGDWPTATVQRNNYSNTGNYVGVFYYEQYDDGAYGIYAVGYVEATSLNDATVVVNTLSQKGETTQKTGYGIFHYSGCAAATRNRGWRYAVNQVNNQSTCVTDAGDYLTELSGYTFLVIADGSSTYTLRYAWGGGNNNARGQISLTDARITAARTDEDAY